MDPKFVLGFWYVVIGLVVILATTIVVLMRRKRGKHKKSPLRAIIIAFWVYTVVFVVGGSNFFTIQKKNPNALAQTAGTGAKLTEVKFFLEHGGRYADNLADLARIDPSLTADGNVTFIFGPCNQSGYTFMTRHLNGDTAYPWTMNNGP